ncbi:MAG: hypothetical protein N2380_09045 [bacterium]|nr:hypothetical protein [bacterium]
MLYKVLDYIKSQRFVNIERLKRDLNISEEEWDLIFLQLRDLGYVVEKDLTNNSNCALCPYAKACKYGCIKG